MASQKTSVLFICLGNICRSPIAEAIFRKMVTEKGLSSEWHIDSAAIGSWHVGGGPDKRGRDCMKKHDIQTDHIVRQIKEDDFRSFDIIFGMDDDNMCELASMKPKNATAKLKMLGEYDPQEELVIEDPYYGVDEDFETVFTQCERCCKAFLLEQTQIQNS